LQLLHYAALHARSRTDEVKGICDRLNDMAKATKLPVILAAQFNRDATKAGGDTLDGVELANIGESSGIENIAEDVYLVWQTDKIKPESKQYTDGGKFNLKPYQYRSRRCFKDAQDGNTLRRGYLYVENLKARDYATGGYCLLPYNGAAGAITSDDSAE
jgi:replicative DNA helicase